MNIIDKIKLIEEKAHSYQAKRTAAQLRYAYRISEVNSNGFDQIVDQTASKLISAIERNGTISNQDALEAETDLAVLSTEAKKYTLLCVAHAHIDMNWMWGFNETVAITLDTFRTVLRLMQEYPAITFSQSQASTYQIVETYDSQLFAAIQDMIRSGRWEVTASTWVEADKNMTSSESLARHILYTKQYFKEKFNIDYDDLLLDFEPDTFGHNLGVPEILASGNVKYYFHCRGYDKEHIYNWQSPSGAEILVHREPDWYNTQINYDYADFAPRFCRDHNINKVLRVYGVGDHGGGPTRRDIERLLDMQTWPCYAAIEFSSYSKYFRYLESVRERFPVVRGELNYVFTGCYSSESRIKMANRIAEDSLYTSEYLSAVDTAYAKGDSYIQGYKKAWIKTLFSQFHDILPGSGIRETREHALGELAKILGYTYAGKAKALNHLAAQIDTSEIEYVLDRESFADGAGMGYKGVAETNASLVRGLETGICDNGSGKTRIFHLFNPTAWDRTEIYTFALWDWPGDISRLQLCDHKSNKVKHVVINSNEVYWAHKCHNIKALVTVPGFGYTTLIVSEGISENLEYKMFDAQPLVERYQDYVLENELVKINFDSNMQIRTFIDKNSGEEIICGESGFFTLNLQNHKLKTIMKGNAWVEGYPLKEINLNQSCPVYVTEIDKKDNFQQVIKYELKYGKSSIKVTLSLDANQKMLVYLADVDWHEVFSPETGIPALKFNLPFNFQASSYEYKTACGTISRSELNHDVPSLGFAGVFNRNIGKSLILLTDSVYAFRGENNSLKLTLLRASQYPDKYPEYGIHNYKIGVGICEPEGYHQIDHTFRYPIQHITNTVHNGKFKLEGRFIGTSDNLAVSCVKVAEDGNGIVMRVYETLGKEGNAFISFKSNWQVQAVDILERNVSRELEFDGDLVRFAVKPNEMISLRGTKE